MPLNIVYHFLLNLPGPTFSFYLTIRESTLANLWKLPEYSLKKSDFFFIFVYKSLDYYLTIQHALPSSDEESRYGLFVFILIKPTSINRSRLKDNTSGIKRTLGDIHMSLNTRRFWIVWSKRKKNTICCMYIK